MNITEKDLFKFVFYKSELPQKKQNFITENLDKFSSSIKFLTEIKSQSEIELSPSIMGRIHDLIANQYLKKEFVLTPVITEDCSDYLTLAADSNSKECDENSRTFTDPGNNYMVKVISEGTENKLFLFSRDKNVNSDLSLTIYPSNEKHLINKSSSNIILLQKQRIDKIIIMR